MRLKKMNFQGCWKLKTNSYICFALFPLFKLIFKKPEFILGFLFFKSKVLLLLCVGFFCVNVFLC